MKRITKEDYTYYLMDKVTEPMEAIYRGCPTEVCYCTGRCREIVGWKNTKTNEIKYDNPSSFKSQEND